MLIATVSSLSGMLEREVYIVAGHSGVQVVSFSLVELNRWGFQNNFCNSPGFQQRRQWQHLLTTRVSVNSWQSYRVDWLLFFLKNDQYPQTMLFWG